LRSQRFLALARRIEALLFALLRGLVPGHQRWDTRHAEGRRFSLRSQLLSDLCVKSGRRSANSGTSSRRAGRLRRFKACGPGGAICWRRRSFQVRRPCWFNRAVRSEVINRTRSPPATRAGCTAMAENAGFPPCRANHRCYFHGSIAGLARRFTELGKFEYLTDRHLRR
jgi:hypothetical protein